MTRHDSDQLHTCPDRPAPDSDLIGCGETFEQTPDDEGWVDCPHCGMAFDAARAVAERVADLELALGWALGILIKFEPGDSRAVSDEFVAAAAIHCSVNERLVECRDILAKALAEQVSA